MTTLGFCLRDRQGLSSRVSTPISEAATQQDRVRAAHPWTWMLFLALVGVAIVVVGQLQWLTRPPGL